MSKYSTLSAQFEEKERELRSLLKSNLSTQRSGRPANHTAQEEPSQGRIEMGEESYLGKEVEDPAEPVAKETERNTTHSDLTSVSEAVEPAIEAAPPAPPAPPPPPSNYVPVEFEQATQAEITNASIALEEQSDELNRAWANRVRHVSLGIGSSALAVASIYALSQNPVYESTVQRGNEAVAISVALGTPLVVATGATLLILVFVDLLRSEANYGLLGVLLGKDGRVSTSHVQAFLWTVAVIFAFLFFVVIDLNGGPEFTEIFGENLSEFREEYLLLLGGPFAALVVTKALISGKVASETVQKVESTTTSLKQVVSDDSNRTDLVDTQFFMLNLVALIWFAVALAKTPIELPILPSVLVALTSVSALTYTASKAAETNRPVVTSVTRVAGGPIRPGDLVEIRGVNLLPAGSETAAKLAQLVVRIDAISVSPWMDAPEAPTSERVFARIPMTIPVPQATAAISVSVVTPAGVETASIQVLIAQDKAHITGLTPPNLIPGSSILIRGENFIPAGSSEQSSSPMVRINGSPAISELRDPTTIVAQVPQSLDLTPGSQATLEVQAGPLAVPSNSISILVTDSQ